jgi:protein-disulfide isomerase
MTTNDIPRIAAPVFLAAAVLLSFPPPEPPAVELPAGRLPEPSVEEVRGGLALALAPGAPGHDRGAVRAPVTVLEFADFGCPYCARFAAETYAPLAAELVKTGQVRWRAVPFVLGMFTNGTEAALAAECAADQGSAAFGRMYDALFARQDEWKSSSDPVGVLRSYARATGLNQSRFATCYGSRAPEDRVRAANALADRLGVRATPTFFVNGRRVEGALPAEQFRALLLEALREAHDGND